MRRNTLALLVLCWLIIPTAAAAGGQLTVSPQAYYVSMAGGETHTEDIAISWYGDEPASFVLRTEIFASSTDTVGITAYPNTATIGLQPGQTAILPVTITTRPALKPDIFTIRTNVYRVNASLGHGDRDGSDKKSSGGEDSPDKDRSKKGSNLEGSDGDSDDTSSTDNNLRMCTAADWSCTNWSACTDGTQTRKCTRQNSCDTNGYQPQVSQSCGTEQENTTDKTENQSLTGNNTSTADVNGTQQPQDSEQNERSSTWAAITGQATAHPSFAASAVIATASVLLLLYYRKVFK